MVALAAVDTLELLLLGLADLMLQLVPDFRAVLAFGAALVDEAASVVVSEVIVVVVVAVAASEAEGVSDTKEVVASEAEAVSKVLHHPMLPAVLAREVALAAAAATEVDNPMVRALNTVTRGAMALEGTGLEIDLTAEAGMETAILVAVLEVIGSLSADETGDTEVTEIATETETENEVTAADATTTTRGSGITTVMDTMIQERNGGIEHFQYLVTVCWWVSSYICRLCALLRLFPRTRMVRRYNLIPGGAPPATSNTCSSLPAPLSHAHSCHLKILNVRIFTLQVKEFPETVDALSLLCSRQFRSHFPDRNRKPRPERSHRQAMFDVQRRSTDALYIMFVFKSPSPGQKPAASKGDAIAWLCFSMQPNRTNPTQPSPT